MDPKNYALQWRYRINKMGVYLLDKSGMVIPNNSTQNFKMQITYPLIFNDTDSTKTSYTFSARHFICRYILELGIDNFFSPNFK